MCSCGDHLKTMPLTPPDPNHDVGIRFTVKNSDVERLPVKERNRLLEAHLDDVMVDLLDLPEAIDPSIGVTFSTGAVEVLLTVKARSEKKAWEKADALIRTAVHAAGGFTGGWDIKWDEEPEARKSGLVDA